MSYPKYWYAIICKYMHGICIFYARTCMRMISISCTDYSRDNGRAISWSRSCVVYIHVNSRASKISELPRPHLVFKASARAVRISSSTAVEWKSLSLSKSAWEFCCSKQQERRVNILKGRCPHTRSTVPTQQHHLRPFHRKYILP